MMLCAIWYRLYNFKNVKNGHGGVLATLIKVTLLHGRFSRFLNCIMVVNRTKHHVFRYSRYGVCTGKERIVMGFILGYFHQKWWQSFLKTIKNVNTCSRVLTSRRVTTSLASSWSPIIAHSGILFSSQYWNWVKSFGLLFGIISA